MSSSTRHSEAVLRRLEWTVMRRLDGLVQGDYRTLFRGFGMDLADLREYQSHDDVRHIDWNVTARTQVPHVRVYNDDREVSAWFVLDLSPSVDFGSGEITKRQVLAEFTAVLARLLTRQGNKVGAMLHDGVGGRVLPPRGGRGQVLAILEAIAAHPRRPSAPETDLGVVLGHALGAIRRRSLVFIVSDFVSRPGWERRLGQLAQRHEGVAVRLVDPLESVLPDLGFVTFQDAETGEQILVDTHDRGFRRRFSAMAEEKEAELVARFSEAGMDVLELSTGDDLTDALLRFSDLRKMRARGGGGVPAHLGGGMTGGGADLGTGARR